MSNQLGSSLTPDGAEFAVFSAHAARVFLCLYEDGKERDRILMQRGKDDIHRAILKGISAGQTYGYRADGVYDSKVGHCFDSAKLLIDPYARAIDRHAKWYPELSQRGAETGHLAPKSILTAELAKAKRRKVHTPSFVYELNVRSFSMRHPDIDPALQGTMAALATPPALEHFKTLGCDTIELMPIAAWTDERHLAQMGLRNAWGYNPVSFMATEPLLAPGGPLEVKDTLSRLHDHGLQVVLDVVFNHTGESDFGGGTFSLRGLDNASYFRMHDGQLVNDAGTGNTMMLDSPPATRLVLDAMHHWIGLGFDGFRYDLAPVMGRTASGFTVHAPLLAAIQADAALRDIIHIAEPWDVGPGGYQLGQFPNGWLEWNDSYREDMRKFWRGDSNMTGAFATRLAGSSDYFAKSSRRPSASVNFLAAHDGFPLADVVRFDRKQNHANGEENRDGNAHEASWIADDSDMAIRCMLATLFLSRGTPMLTAGDEFGRTQHGNNNAYAQDNEITWLDWAKADTTLMSFVRSLLDFRKAHKEFFSDAFLKPGLATWFSRHGSEMNQSDWQNGATSDVALVVSGSARARLALLFSRDGKVSDFMLPKTGDLLVWNDVSPADCSDCVRLLIEVKQ
jgi:glycogen debranching enzyme